MQTNVDAHYLTLTYVTKIKNSKVKATMGKYLSLKNFRTSIATSISSMFLKRTTVWQSTSDIKLCRNAGFLSHQIFFISRLSYQELKVERHFFFLPLGNEQFSFILLFVSWFMLFHFLIIFKVQNIPKNLFLRIWLIVITSIFAQVIVHSHNSFTL